MNSPEVHAGLGLVQMKLKKYKGAVQSFENAVKLEPDNLYYRSNLAKSLLKERVFDRSETEYKNILEISSYHIDSILGIGELNISIGDSDHEKDRLADSEDRYSEAIDYLNQALTLADDGDYENNEASRKLNNIELSTLCYSLGYAKVKLFEVRGNYDDKLLRSARKLFDRVEEGTSNYQKAKRARKKIHDRIEEYKKAGTTRGAGIVVVIAVFIFLVGQFSFFVGRPVIYSSVFSINAQKLDDLLKSTGLNISSENQNILANKQYFAEDNIVEELSQTFATDTLPQNELVKIRKLIDRQKKWGLTKFAPIESTLYAVLTFGSLIFIIAGLYLKEISRLRIGPIELEKTTSEQLTSSSSLGIGR